MSIKKNLDLVIYDQIINSLILREYEMGDQILLDSFTEKYGVSRTPVVQAVKLLASDGILEILKNGRVRVPVYTPSQISQICDIRILLELYALDTVFADSDSQKFSEICEKLGDLAATSLQYSTSGDYLSFNKSDLKFHKLLVGASDNEFLLDIYKQIQNRFIVANYLYTPLKGRDFTAAAQAHLDIMDVFRKKELATCKKLLTEHIHSVIHQ